MKPYDCRTCYRRHMTAQDERESHRGLDEFGNPFDESSARGERDDY